MGRDHALIDDHTHVPIVPVVLSGGSGTRLWPVSRSLHPKQLLPIAADHSMLQATVARFADTVTFAAPIVVGGEEHRFLIADQLDAAGVAPAAIVLEPEGRNTAAAIALAAHHVGPDAVLLVVPSDHVIADPAAFRAAVAVAVPAAVAGKLVTFGIAPTGPETGYGYIERGPALDGHAGVFAVARFVEKPDAATAAGFVADGRYAWNGGIFVFTARVPISPRSTRMRRRSPPPPPPRWRRRPATGSSSVPTARRSSPARTSRSTMR